MVNGNRAGTPTASSINMYMKSPIPQAYDEDISVINANSWILTIGDRSKQFILLREDPSLSDSTA